MLAPALRTARGGWGVGGKGRAGRREPARGSPLSLRAGGGGGGEGGGRVYACAPLSAGAGGERKEADAGRRVDPPRTNDGRVLRDLGLSGAWAAEGRGARGEGESGKRRRKWAEDKMAAKVVAPLPRPPARSPAPRARPARSASPAVRRFPPGVAGSAALRRTGRPRWRGRVAVPPRRWPGRRAAPGGMERASPQPPGRRPSRA